jgi:hypothetical protein
MHFVLSYHVWLIGNTPNIKIKIFPVHAMKAYWGNEGMAPRIRVSALVAAFWITASTGHFRHGKVRPDIHLA